MKLCAALAAFVMLTAAPARAQTPSPAPNAAEPGIRIARLATFHAAFERRGQPRRGVMECVSFVNDAPREVKHVRFVFAFDGVDGEMLGADVLDRSGKFSTGILNEGMTANQMNVGPALGKLVNCREFSGLLDRNDNMVVFKKDRIGPGEVRFVRAFVEAVDYADGGAWHAQPPYESLIDKPVVRRLGDVVVHADGGLDWSSPATGPIVITHANFFTYGFKSMECISFKNAGVKPVASFRVHFTYHALDGSIPEENTQTRTGEFAPGIENFGATDDGSSAPQFRNCWSYKAPRVDPATVTITIPAVTFTDGTTTSS